jgi:hypothetical protein
MQRIHQRPTSTVGYCASSIAKKPFVENHLPAIHRFAASGALLRDSRLEIAVGHRGELRARMVAGVIR